MRRFYFLYVFIVFYSALNAQVLKPYIGLDEIPKPTDSMCSIQNYLGSFEDSGYKIGDTVHDFTIYNLDFDELSLSETLKKGKPVLLISSSYTCPVFRNKIPVINEIASLYKDLLEIYVIYTIEAHPDKDISPYFGKVHTGSHNINDGILFRQPVIYGDRMQIVIEMLNQMTLNVPVYIDGPCNQWWYHYGPAPNNATLIDPNGIVRIKHAWFDREPDNIICDIKKYFEPNAACDTIQAGNSEFEFTMNSDTIVRGEVNAVLAVSGTIKNVSNVPVLIEIRRLQNELPLNWSSSICLDVCYSTTVDSTMISLKPNEEIELIIDFFTGPDAAQGSVQIGMKNVDHPKNKAFMRGIAITSELVSVGEEKNEPDVMIYPRPATSYLNISSEHFNHFELFDENGIVYQKGFINKTHTVYRESMPSGLYILKLSKNNAKPIYHMVVFN